MNRLRAWAIGNLKVVILHIHPPSRDARLYILLGRGCSYHATIGDYSEFYAQKIYPKAFNAATTANVSKSYE